MRKTIAIAGATAIIIGGVGSAAYAASGTPTPSASTSPASDSVATPPGAAKTTQAGQRRDLDRLRRAVHATWVTENKRTRTFTTHDAIRGHVSAVSPTSITVTAADDLTETFVVSANTKVHTRTLKKAATISDVKSGDPVFVGGTGTTTMSAIRVVDTKK